ncbi:hypothetical protein BHE90_008434 [Fusarium euwallaceae]|uniref:Uncharacterized protein n=1 Tax=Fusarium euwallaceae TaxID=1147111 RepID=A0A430LMZ0_9HYPO|nr:hypothetical protein BHE90_008434 [Fusarium euwallaceae]
MAGPITRPSSAHANAGLLGGFLFCLCRAVPTAELIILAVKTSYGIFCILSLLLGNKKTHLLISRRAQFSVVCALLPNDSCLDSVGHIPHQLGLKHCLSVLIQVTAVVRFEPTGPFLHSLAGDLV